MAVIGILMIFIGAAPSLSNLLMQKGYSTSIEALTEKPEIKINYASDTVHRTENIYGTATNIPKESHLWIVVYSHNISMYYPIGEVEPDQNGEWIYLTTIGGSVP